MALKMPSLPCTVRRGRLARAPLAATRVYVRTYTHLRTNSHSVVELGSRGEVVLSCPNICSTCPMDTGHSLEYTCATLYHVAHVYSSACPVSIGHGIPCPLGRVCGRVYVRLGIGRRIRRACEARHVEPSGLPCGLRHLKVQPTLNVALGRRQAHHHRGIRTVISPGCLPPGCALYPSAHVPENGVESASGCATSTDENRSSHRSLFLHPT